MNQVLNLDFQPPAAERLLLLPSELSYHGISEIIIRLLDNFPWTFESRLLSCGTLPEEVMGHLVKLLDKQGISFSLMFPGASDLGRLLRIPGYRRMFRKEENILTINPEATGFKRFMDDVLEDITALCENISSFYLLESEASEHPEYHAAVAEIIGEYDIALRILKNDCVMSPFEQFCSRGSLGFSGKEVPAGYIQSFKNFEDGRKKIALLSSELRYLISIDAAGVRCITPEGKNISMLYREMDRAIQQLSKISEELTDSGSGFADIHWLEAYSRSVLKSCEEDYLQSGIRLSQCGLIS